MDYIKLAERYEAHKKFVKDNYDVISTERPICILHFIATVNKNYANRKLVDYKTNQEQLKYILDIGEPIAMKWFRTRKDSWVIPEFESLPYYNIGQVCPPRKKKITLDNPRVKKIMESAEKVVTMGKVNLLELLEYTSPAGITRLLNETNKSLTVFKPYTNISTQNAMEIINTVKIPASRKKIFEMAITTLQK